MEELQKRLWIAASDGDAKEISKLLSLPNAAELINFRFGVRSPSLPITGLSSFQPTATISHPSAGEQVDGALTGGATREGGCGDDSVGRRRGDGSVQHGAT